MTQEQQEEGRPPRYHIDAQGEAARKRSLPLLVSSRRCQECQDADQRDGLPGDEDLPSFLKTIQEHCSSTPDYLTPDTPLKEAIFRVLLANGNQPMTAQEISQVLQEQWAMTPYPRRLDAAVIQRLLDHSSFYCIARVPEEEEQ